VSEWFCHVDQVEALLRALFRQLDPQDSGAVPCRLVLKCLKSVALSGLLRCPPGSSRVRAGAVEEEERAEGMGDSLWALLVRGLEAMVSDEEEDGDARTVTWGEVRPTNTHVAYYLT
jgi:hypothetical protein